MSLTGDHDSVETLLPNRADQSLGVRILPWWQPEADGGHNEEINGSNLRSVIAQECAPGLTAAFVA